MTLHRTHASAIAAVLLPGAWLLWWPLGLLLLVGIVLLRSLTGVLGALAAAVVLYPVAALAVLPVMLVAVWLRQRIPPGAALKTARARLVTWLYLLRTWSWRGTPWYGPRVACESAWVRSGGASMTGGPPHNEFLTLAYRFGLAAVVAMLSVAIITGPMIHNRTLGGATLAAAVAVCSVSSPVTMFWRWLRKGREGPLFGPPLRFVASFYLAPDGQLTVFCTRPMTPQERAEFVQAVFTFGTQVARQAGIEITLP